MSDEGEMIATAISDTDANASIEALRSEIHATGYEICKALSEIQRALMAIAYKGTGD